MQLTLPPSYVTTPGSIAYAEVDDAPIVTMTHILGLLAPRLRALAGPED